MSIRRVGSLILVFLSLCVSALGCNEKTECGNGKIEGDEQCDKNLGGITCRDLGHDRGLLSCTFKCTYNEKMCIDCGNGEAEDGEVCDGDDLDGFTCEHFGYAGGDLACNENCTFDKSNCYLYPPLTFVVLEHMQYTGEEVPLQGATVALDAPYGGRIEKITGADGKVTFEGINWSTGQTSVTAHLDGYLVMSLLDIDTSRIWGDMPIYLSKIVPDQPETARISGTATGMIGTDHTLVVNVINSPVGSEWQGPSDATFSATVMSGEPFILQGLDTILETLPSGRGYTITMFQVAHQEFDPVTEDTSGVVLDFSANQVPFFTADTWFILPGRTASPLRTGSAACWVFDSQSSYSIGWAAYIDISPDEKRQFDATLIWTEPTWSEETRTACQVYNTEGLGASTFYVEGYPQPGVLGYVMDVPEWITPEDPATPHPIHAPLEWEEFDGGVHNQLIIQRNGRTIWVLNKEHHHPAPLAIPDLPSSAVAEDFLGTAPLPTYLLAGYLSEDKTKWIQVAQAQMILLAP